MGKHQTPKQAETKANKTHKTLRDKLRKKRQGLKVHKKEKSQKKKQYNREEQKLMFFNQDGNKNQQQHELKMKRIIKHIEKFINIYEDDLQEFYDLFDTFDKGGKIDISALENKAMMKCLRKMFRYLPLVRDNGEYKKLESSGLKLALFMRNKNYLENGSRQGDSDDESSGEENQEGKKKEKKQKRKKQKKVRKEEQEEGFMGPVRLYKETPTKVSQQVMGPSIPEEERQKMALLFDQQLQDLKKHKQEHPEQKQDEFDQIFSMYQTRSQMKAEKKVTHQGNQDVPAHLMAAGSARLGEKVDVDQESIDQYNRINRPKKLIDLHKEIYQSGGQQQTKKRQPFTRERDILGNAKTKLMQNSTFFDFRSKMTKPTKTNQFL